MIYDNSNRFARPHQPSRCQDNQEMKLKIQRDKEERKEGRKKNKKKGRKEKRKKGRKEERKKDGKRRHEENRKEGWKKKGKKETKNLEYQRWKSMKKCSKRGPKIMKNQQKSVPGGRKIKENGDWGCLQEVTKHKV